MQAVLPPHTAVAPLTGGRNVSEQLAGATVLPTPRLLCIGVGPCTKALAIGRHRPPQPCIPKPRLIMVIIAAQLHYTSTSQRRRQRFNILSFPAHRAVQLVVAWRGEQRQPREDHGGVGCHDGGTRGNGGRMARGGQVAGRFSPANSNGIEVMRCGVMLLRGCWMSDVFQLLTCL